MNSTIRENTKTPRCRENKHRGKMEPGIKNIPKSSKRGWRKGRKEEQANECEVFPFCFDHQEVQLQD